MNPSDLLRRIRSVIGPCEAFTPLHIPNFVDRFDNPHNHL
jgi:hypothetical protein